MGDLANKSLFFNEFELMPSQRLLKGPGGEIDLRPTSLNVLVYLAQAAGRVVPKEELLDAIWPDVTVSEESLTRCISDIRQALADDERKIIKTISRRGYVFAVDARDAPTSVPPRPRRGKANWMALVAAAAALSLVAGSISLSRPGAADIEKPLVAILPLTDTGAHDGEAYFADGLTEDISFALSRFGSIDVVAWSSAAEFKGSSDTMPVIGKMLGARFLVTGNIRRISDQIVLSLRLSDAASGAQIWSGQYDGRQEGFLGAKTQLMGSIASILDKKITKTELDRVSRMQSLNMTSYDLVLQANALIRNAEAQDRGSNIATARDLYERAAAIDARYADAVEGIANTYLMAWLEPLSDSRLRLEFQSPNALKWAGDYARKAVELDETSASARATLGWILNWQSGPTEGLTFFDQALLLNPGLVDWHYGLLLSHGGRAADAEAYMKRIMTVDPLHPPRYKYLLGKAYYFQGRYEEALPLIRQAAAEMQTHRPSHVLLAAVSAEMGYSDDLPGQVEDIYRLDPRFNVSDGLDYIRISDVEYADRLRFGLLAAGLPER